MQNRYNGYLGIAKIDLIDHLMNWYRKITPIDIKGNKNRTEDSIDNSQPINIYFKHFDDTIQFAANGITPCTTN